MSGTAGLQWKRKASLVVEPPGLDLSELRFRFEVSQQQDGTPNAASVRVFNLAEATTKVVMTESTRVTIQAGYENTAAGVIFDGTIVQTRRGRERNVDSYLDINAAEGDLPYNFGLVNQTFGPGVTPQQLWAAYGQVLEPYGFKAGDPSALIGGILPRGKVAFGMAIDYMGHLCVTSGATWTFHDGVVVPIPLTGYLPDEAVVLNSQSGLVGQPEATQQGVQVVCLINPRIRVGTRIQIDNGLINQTNDRGPGLQPNYANPFAGAFASVTEDGYYRVMVCEYEGDTRGPPWYQKLTCLALDPSAKPAQSAPLYP